MIQRYVLVGFCLLLTGCGPDRDKLSREIREEVKRDLEKQLKRELEKKMRSELALLEGRLRRRLGLPPARRSRPVPSMKAPASDPKTDPKAAMTAATPGPDGGVPSTLPTSEPVEDSQGLKIKRILFAKQLVQRKPEGIGKEFTLQDRKVYCYLDAANPKGPKRLLQVVWHHRGKEFHRVRLRIGVGHVWRTWAFLRIRKRFAGDWQCSVFNETNQLLAKGTFSIK